MPAMPPVLAASAPAPEAFRNPRRVTRAMLFPPMLFYLELVKSNEPSLLIDAARDKLCARA
jgi:hypothetical protein